MKLFKLMLPLLAVCPIFAQVYQRTEGPITLYVRDFSTANYPAPVIAQKGEPTPAAFLWVTVCTTDKAVTPVKAIIDYRADGHSITNVLSFDTSGLWQYGCVSGLLQNVKRADVISLSVVTASAEFADVSR